MCRVLEVSSSGYYAWCQRLPSQHSRDDAQLAQAVQKAFQANRQVYGSPRIHADLKEQGKRCARKRVARLMRELGLTARRPTHRTITTKSEKGAQVAENLLQRDESRRSTQHEMGDGYDLHLDFRGMVVSRNCA